MTICMATFSFYYIILYKKVNNFFPRNIFFQNTFSQYSGMLQMSSWYQNVRFGSQFLVVWVVCSTLHNVTAWWPKTVFHVFGPHGPNFCVTVPKFCTHIPGVMAHNLSTLAQNRKFIHIWSIQRSKLQDRAAVFDKIRSSAFISKDSGLKFGIWILGSFVNIFHIHCFHKLFLVHQLQTLVMWAHKGFLPETLRQSQFNFFIEKLTFFQCDFIFHM